MPFSSNSRGALFMVISMAGFTMNDSIVKAVLVDANMGQVIMIRGVFATVMIAALAWYQGVLHQLRAVVHPYVLIRGAAELGATVFFLTALANLPLGNVSAVLQALPLAVTLGAVLVVGETVGWRRWIAIAVGFAGVVIIVRPGMDGFSIYSVVALVSVFFAAGRDLLTTRIPERIPSILVSLTTSITITVLGAVATVATGSWTPMEPASVVKLAVAAVLLIIGYQFIIMSVRTAEVSFIAPFRYTSLLWAILLGYLLFGDVPDLAMIIGAILVVGSGLYALYREQVRRRPIVAETTSPSMTPDGL